MKRQITVKLRLYEKATKFEKNLPPVLTKLLKTIQFFTNHVQVLILYLSYFITTVNVDLYTSET